MAISSIDVTFKETVVRTFEFDEEKYEAFSGKNVDSATAREVYDFMISTLENFEPTDTTVIDSEDTKIEF